MSGELRAYHLSSAAHECGHIVYAESRNEAKGMAGRSDALCDDDWTDLRVKLEPKAQQWATKKGLEHKPERYRELGWWCEDGGPSCDTCGKMDWSDGDNPAWVVCPECFHCGECGHQSDCLQALAMTLAGDEWDSYMDSILYGGFKTETPPEGGA